MVTDTSSTLAQRLWRGFRRDIDGLRALVAAPPPPAPGLYTYRLTPAAGQRRLHLRVNDNGTGALFVDVTDVIHLNPTAMQMAALALEGVPIERAHTLLRARFGGAGAEHLRGELAQTYAMIERLSGEANGCPTCAAPTLEHAPLFSAPASAPYKVDVALTYGCNNACAHCYNETGRLGMPSLPFLEWCYILDKLARVGVPHIIFTGGEPSLHPDLPRLIAHADSLGQIVGMNTNGRRLSHRPYAQALADAGLNHVQITLGSCDPAVHNAIMHASAFEQTVRGIDNALASGIHTITNTTLMRRNMGHVEDLIDFLHARGVRTFAMNGMIYSGGGFAHPDAIPEAEMAPLLVRVRDYAAERGMRFLWYTPTEYCRLSPVELEIGVKRCNAGEYSMCVEPDGSVLPCQSYYVAAGSLLHDPWEHIWNSDLFRSFRERVANPQAAGLPEMCHTCPDLPLCAGGCRIEREARAGRRTTSAEASNVGFVAAADIGSGRAQHRASLRL